ncbi:MAG: LysR family transcriptional regulator [Thalassobaculum sp.]
MITLRQVRYFLAVAETEKVSAAATNLGISQSAITLSIKELENQLGVTLFERRVGGVALTREGQNFIGHARNIEAAVADAVADMHPDRTDVEGTVKLGVTNAGAGYFLVPPLARFQRAFPNVSVQLLERERVELEDQVLAGTVDIALLLTSNLSNAPDLEHRGLFQSPRGAWVATNHPLASRDTVSRADVIEFPYILYQIDEADRSSREYLAASGLEPKVLFETTSLEALRSMVATGQGVTILSRMLFRPWSLDGGRLEWIPITDAPPPMEIGLVWRKGHEFTAAEARLVEYLEAAVR